MAKKENFQEYVARTQNEIAGIESKIEAEELKKLQLEHKMQRLQNVTEYKVNKSKKTRVSRLITKGVGDGKLSFSFNTGEEKQRAVRDCSGCISRRRKALQYLLWRIQ